MSAPSAARRAPIADEDRTLGRYELAEEIGHGGMANVYLARARGPAGFQKWFAIKRIHERMAKDREFVEMFLDEARLAASLQHQNVAQTLELGEEDGRYFIAMEYLHGEPISAVTRRHLERGGPIDPELAAFICAEAAEGLHHAHEARDENGEPLQLVHRDVSPHNIFATYEGRVALTDFGVAKARGRLTQTETGVVKGKLAYAAPEQLRGETMDRRVDVFALGVVLFEISTGRRLFKAETEAETLQRICSGYRVAPSTLVSGYPEELEEILSRALADDRDERTPTARQLASELKAFLAGRGVDTTRLAERMRELFPDEIAEKTAILRSSSTQEPAPREGSSGDAAVVEEPSRSRSRVTTPPPARSRAPQLIALALLLLAAAGAAAWFLMPTHGEIQITTDPADTRVLLDGVPIGEGTPLLVEDATYGEHEVRVERDGYEPEERRLQLGASRYLLNVTLHEVGQGDVVAAVAGPADPSAPPESDSADLHATDTSATDPSDPELDGDATETADSANAESDVADPDPDTDAPTAEPRRRPGQLTLVTVPWASVRLNGRDAGNSPLYRVSVPSGRVRVVLRAQGTGPPVSRVYRVRPGESVSHRETLPPAP